MKALHLLACGLSFAGVAAAHDIITTNLTFTRDISRIFATHCVACHSSGSAIPFTTYEEARPWAVAIKEQVLSRAMPPWGAVKGFGDLAPDYGLSQEDILIIAGWVVGGAPQGSPQLLPRAQTSVAIANPRLQDGPVVNTHLQLNQTLEVAGIRPIAQSLVDSTQVVAKLPDGRIVPLLWLYHFDPKTHRSFALRQPIALPSGTVIESSAALQFALQTK